MNRIRLALLVTLLVACGGGGSDPVTPPQNEEPPIEVPSGSFQLASTPTTDGCVMATEWAGTYDIVINGTSFTMGPFTGTWNPKTLSTVAESEKIKTTTRSCTTTRWSTLYITFYGANHFAGTVVYRLRLGGTCSPDRKGCTTNWVVTGDRQ